MPATTTKKKSVKKTTKRKKNLVIVESPSKAKTIQKYLGSNYKVTASLGHLRDLPKSQMGIDIEQDYEPKYISIRGKGPIIKDLKKDVKNSKKVFLASDPDREGEAIAWHLTHLLGLEEDQYSRVTFNEITKDAVKEAFKHPRDIDMNLVDAQQARRILDRLVGYSISPILWQKVKKGLSAGRVQSVALHLIINREKEIKQFKPEEYWEIEGIFKKDKNQIQADFYGIKDKKVNLKNNEEVKEVISQIDAKKPFTVKQLVKKNRKRKPGLPFTTSVLQQEANKRLNFKTRKTMMVAQQLYEGINLGSKSGTVGLITYMRTDSTRISGQAKSEAGKFILENFGKEYLGAHHKNLNKAKNNEKIQDAHEAVRPTSVTRTPESLKSILSKDQYKLYKLIWDRFVGSQMSDSVSETITATFEQNNVEFKSSGSKTIFPGFTKVYNFGKKENDNENKILGELAENETVNVKSFKPEQHFTQPPARYTEAALIKALEENGVGRPSTYSPTLDTIQKRYYVKLNAKRFEPTELGEIVNKIVNEYFPEISNIKFTANIENDFDEIEQGKKDWVTTIDQFYLPFQKEVIHAEKEAEKIIIKDEPAGENCEICGAPMVIKMGRFGKFMACSRFPDCRNTKAIVKEIGVKCPKCKIGEVIERKSKKNRIFYGCNRYPECDFVSWDKPIGRDCPVCGHYLVEKVTKNGKKKQVVCPNGDYEEDIQG